LRIDQLANIQGSDLIHAHTGFPSHAVGLVCLGPCSVLTNLVYALPPLRRSVHRLTANQLSSSLLISCLAQENSGV
jgi:hypothetical protein